MDDDLENQTQAIVQDRENQPETGSSEKPGSSEGKLWIKLRIPKDGDGRDEDRIGPQRNDQPRVCNVCNKKFSSGKALGGHMRVHVQAEKEREEFLLKKLKTNHHPVKYKSSKLRPELPENRDGPNAAADDKPTCSLCGKNFPSMKSLFGHMRCHPEREWRGIQPPAPATAKNSSALLVSDAEPERVDHRIDSDCATMGSRAAIDLTQVLPGWTVTARRGRKALTAANRPARRVLSLVEEEQLREAVQDLMRLAHGDSLESGLTHGHGVEVREGTNSDSMTNKAEIEDKNWVLESKKRRIEESPVGYKRDFPAKKPRIDGNLDKGKGKIELETDYMSLTDEELDCKNSDGSTVPSEEQLIKNYKCESNINSWPVMVMIKSKKKKKRKKLKMRDLESVRDGIGSPLLPVEDQIHRRSKTNTNLVPPDRDRYKCSTCNKCFPTHQALGGHRSSHNKVRSLINTTTSHTIIDDSSSSPADEIYPQTHPALKSKLRNSQTVEESSSQAYDDETKEEEEADELGAAAADDSNNTHQCNICSKRFPTGQALGGHKRCHWTGTHAANSPGEAGRKILDFDLNQLPAMEEEVGEYGDGGVESEVHTGGYGNAASSSHNSIA